MGPGGFSSTLDQAPQFPEHIVLGSLWEDVCAMGSYQGGLPKEVHSP